MKSEDSTVTSKEIIDILSRAAEKTLPLKPKRERDSELWKNYAILNEVVTKKIKKRVAFLGLLGMPPL